MSGFARALIEGGGIMSSVSPGIMKAVQASGGKFVNAVSTRLGKKILIEEPSGKVRSFLESEITSKGLPKFEPVVQKTPSEELGELINKKR